MFRFEAMKPSAPGNIVSAVVLGLAVSTAALGQDYPDKPIRVIANSTAGGPLDAFARLVTEQMAIRLRQPFVVESRPGAGGNIATAAVAKAAPDGMTILFSVDTTFTINPALYRQVPFDPERDFIAVSLLATFGQMITISPGLPVNSVRELVQYSKERKLNYGSAGNGLPSHLSFAYMQSVTGVQASHVPYKGNPPVLIALLNGEIDAAMVISTSVLQQARAGKLKMLAYSAPQRSVAAPDIPTMAEQGFPGFDATFGYLLFVPANTPDAIVKTLHDEAVRAVTAPDLRERLKTFDVAVVGLPPPESASWLRAARRKWDAVIREGNLRAE